MNPAPKLTVATTAARNAYWRIGCVTSGSCRPSPTLRCPVVRDNPVKPQHRPRTRTRVGRPDPGRFRGTETDSRRISPRIVYGAR
jgi:hypothetical protein